MIFKNQISAISHTSNLKYERIGENYFKEIISLVCSIKRNRYKLNIIILKSIIFFPWLWHRKIRWVYAQKTKQKKKQKPIIRPRPKLKQKIRTAKTFGSF